MMSTVEFYAGSVRKSFSNPDAFHREMKVYQLGLPHVPSLISCSEPEWILTERVAGIPYLDSVHFPKRIDLMAKSIAEFHLGTYVQGRCLCQWDNQPGNILLSEVDCHLVDFADSRISAPEEDISHLFLFWASEMPAVMFVECCGVFLKHYGEYITLNPGMWETTLQSSITRFDKRRRLYNKASTHTDNSTIQANRDILQTMIRVLPIS